MTNTLAPSPLPIADRPLPVVYIVGGGPGDPGLLTLRGRECLERCRCVIYDALVASELLDYAPADAERIYVGKRASQHSASQEEINALLVEKARQHGPVCRLKGGDPFVFGRGGEEALYLVAHGIPFEVVPGVTSATAVPAYAGIPVTHRGASSSLAVITGHEDPEKGESSLSWEHLAAGVDTLVILMGVGNLAQIVEQLIRHGRPPDTPAAIVRWGTTPGQTTLVAPLADLARRAEQENWRPPSVIVIGEVVRLREQLRWWELRPLVGRTVVVTRARAQAGELASRLRGLGARVIQAAAIRIADPDSLEPLDAAIRRLDQYHYVVFTSVNGVERFLSRLRHHRLDVRSLHGRTIACIGKPTAEALERHGIIADMIPARYQAEGLLELFEGKDLQGARLLIPRAQVARPILEDGLRQMGAEVDIVPAYRTLPAEDFDRDGLLDDLRHGRVDYVTFMSSGTVHSFAELLGANAETRPSLAELLGRARIACVGPITRETLAEYGLTAHITAKEASVESLVQALLDDIHQSQRNPVENRR